MPDSRMGEGRCLCGSVSVTATEMSKNVGACHCDMCRRWSGGPLLATDCGSNVSFGGEEHVTVFNSSSWAERGFCGKCGTHLFYRLKESGQYIVPTGLFDGAGSDLVFDHQIFVDEKPHFYSFANETKNMTGTEVFAMYAPPTDS